MIKKIDVRAKMTKEGKIIPLEIVWEDGRSFEIDKIEEIKKCASTKGGGSGIRYKCRISGREICLYLDENVWFIES